MEMVPWCGDVMLWDVLCFDESVMRRVCTGNHKDIVRSLLKYDFIQNVMLHGNESTQSTAARHILRICCIKFDFDIQYVFPFIY